MAGVFLLLLLVISGGDCQNPQDAHSAANPSDSVQLNAAAGSVEAASTRVLQSQPVAATVNSTADPFTQRQTVYVDVGKKRQFPLRFPRMKPLPAGAATAFRLDVNDTCGLFTLFHTVYQKQGSGPPPHIHYSEDEYFISAGPGSTRVFTHQKATKFVAGRLPGLNVPPIEAGSAVLTGTGNGVDKWGGQLVFSPVGSVHYFVRETDIQDFFTVYLDGFTDQDIINYVIYGNPSPEQLLLYSGLYGIPHDMTGKFVGYNDSTGTAKPYRQARGPIDVPDAYPPAARLQALFDAVEARKCCKACVW